MRETRVSTLSTLIQHSLGIPSQSNKTGRRDKRNSNRKGRSQTIPICRQHNLIQKRPKNLLDITNTFSQVAGYKIDLQKSVAFLYTNNGQNEKKYRKTIPFTIASQKYLGISLINVVKNLYN
jgi:hypothetical protein